MGMPPEQHHTAAPRGLLIQAGWFLAVFVLLQSCWNASLNTSADAFLTDTLTVKAAVTAIQLLTPASNTIAIGRTISSPGGGIHIGNGCEGVSVLFLLIAAIIASPVSNRQKCQGLLIGSALVYFLNECRIIGLFYAFRTERPLFDLLHHIVAPTAMIILVGLFYLVWSMRHNK